MVIRILLGAAELGLILGIMALGVYISYRILDFPDLTADGSITLGAAVAAVIIGKGYSPWLALAVAPLAGAAAGMVAGLLHTVFKIAPLLAGILTMTGLYSVNLRIMGRANLGLLGRPTVADSLLPFPLPPRYHWLTFASLLTGAVLLLLHWFFRTELGLALRSSGDNETMAKSQGVNVDNVKIFALALSNALVALSGATMAQLQGFADMGMGVGMVVTGLAAVVIGESLFGKGGMGRALLAVIAGSLFYRMIISLALRLGLRTTDLKLVTAVLVVAALSLPQFGSKAKILTGGGAGHATVAKDN